MDSSSDRSPVEPGAKRRKLRKGTHSCWDCKRRKVRCSFATPNDTVCVPCGRRGAKCVSQEMPDVVEVDVGRPRSGDSGGTHMGERISRVESLVGKLFDKTIKRDRLELMGTTTEAQPYLEERTEIENEDGVGRGFPTPSESEQTPITTVSTIQDLEESTSPSIGDDPDKHPCQPVLPNPFQECVDETTLPRAGKHSGVSHALYAAFPNQADSEQICVAVKNANAFFHQLSSFNGAAKVSMGTGNFATQPQPRATPDLHPVLLARKMLIIALYLQQLHLPVNGALTESPLAIMNRLTSTAARLVTTNEEFFGTVESLECIMLDGLFQANAGNLRRAWLVFRRALSAAQLMGLHRKRTLPLKKLDPNSTIDAHFTWFRIVYMDRFFSLMLGLPQGFDGELKEIPQSCSTPTGRFQRTHGVVAGRILERNEQVPGQDDYQLTEAIDLQLLEAARELPSKFWLPVNFTKIREGSQVFFWETMRMVDQFFHFILLVQLHLPYLLRREQSPKTSYSKLACVNASREILTRYVAFRSFNQVTTSCRTADFSAYMGALTLLLAHLDSHRIQRTGGVCSTASLLNHQRLGDRAMMTQVLENMESLSKFSDDTLAEESVKMLRRLLDLEEDASKPNLADELGGEEHAVDVAIPYLGTVRVTRGGLEIIGGCANNSTPVSAPAQAISRAPNLNFNVNDSVHVANSIYASGSILYPQPAPPAPQGSLTTFGHGGILPLGASSQLDVGIDPDLAAALDDWAFQGVDTAFFDNLMRGSSQLFNTNAAGSGVADAAVDMGWEMGAQHQHRHHPL